MPSATKLFTCFGLSFSNVCMRPYTWAATASLWHDLEQWLIILMTQLTSGQHACLLAFVPMTDILDIPLTINLFSLYLMNFMFRTTLDAAVLILRAHYKSSKCYVSFSQGRVSTLLRWGGYVCHAYVKLFFLLTAVQSCINRTWFSRVMITNVLPRFYGSLCS